MVNQDCACLCGASRFTVNGAPIGRFFCHCAICQEIYGKPFADVTYFWARSVALPTRSAHRVSPLPSAARNETGEVREMQQSCAEFVAPRIGAGIRPSQNFPWPSELAFLDEHALADRAAREIQDPCAAF